MAVWAYVLLLFLFFQTNYFGFWQALPRDDEGSVVFLSFHGRVVGGYQARTCRISANPSQLLTFSIDIELDYRLLQ